MCWEIRVNEFPRGPRIVSRERLHSESIMNTIVHVSIRSQMKRKETSVSMPKPNNALHDRIHPQTPLKSTNAFEMRHP